MEYDYTPSMGDLRVYVYSTLNQGPGDESFGVGDFKLVYGWEAVPAPTAPAPPTEPEQPAGPPTNPMPWNDPEDPMDAWTNNCVATRQECDGKFYWGGHGECTGNNWF